MNYFNSLFNQARDLFLSLTPQARLMAILLAGTIVVSAGFLIRGTNVSAKEKLFNGYRFTDSELKLAQIAFGTAKLTDWDTNGNQLLIPRTQRDVYMKALAESGAFPKDLGSWTEKALDSGTMLEGSLKTQSRMLNGRQQAISAAIARIPSIEYAWVNYDEQKEGFSRDVRKTASVFVMPNTNAPISEQLKRHIIRQVSGSFAGLRYEDVTLMDLFSGTSLAGSEDPNNSELNIYHHTKQGYEEDYKKKALNLLSDYSTENGEVRVEVSVELNENLREAVETTTYDKPLAIQSQSSTKTVDSKRSSPGGQPGYDPNVGPNRGQKLNDASSNTKEVSESERRITGRATTLTDKVGLKPKDVSFSVSIPKSYFQKLHLRQWIDLNPTGKPEDAPPLTDALLTQFQDEVSRKIEGQLAVFLPIDPPGDKGANKYKRVYVSHYLDAPLPPLPAPSLAESAIAWLGNSWQTLALLGIALFAILVLRSAIVSPSKTRDEEFARGFGVQVDEAMVGGDLSALMKEGEEGEESETPAGEDAPSRRFTMTGEKVRDELSQIVRENPSAAVNIIRSWIGDAA